MFGRVKLLGLPNHHYIGEFLALYQILIEGTKKTGGGAIKPIF